MTLAPRAGNDPLSVRDAVRAVAGAFGELSLDR